MNMDHTLKPKQVNFCQVNAQSKCLQSLHALKKGKATPSFLNAIEFSHPV